MRRRISVSARCTQQSSTTTSFVRVIRSVTLVALSVLLWITLPPVAAVRKLQIAIPLQALTIWDPECQQEQQVVAATAGDEGTVAAPPTHRGRFLPRFRAGLQAEVATRQTILEQQQQQQQTAGVAVATAETPAVSTVSNNNNKNWAAQAKAIDMQRARVTEERVEQAHDQAVAQYDAQLQELLEQQTVVLEVVGRL